MRTRFLASLVLLIAAPAAAQEQPRVAGYETYAVVAPVADETRAQPFAERHCAKYDRFAHFRWMDGAKAIFDCAAQKAERKQLEPRARGVLLAAPVARMERSDIRDQPSAGQPAQHFAPPSARPASRRYPDDVTAI